MRIVLSNIGTYGDINPLIALALELKRRGHTPIMALPLGLNDEQRQRVLESIAKSNAPVAQISAKPADILPATTPVSEFPAYVKSTAPILGDVSFIRTKDKILLVRAPNMVVTGEISTN